MPVDEPPDIQTNAFRATPPLGPHVVGHRVVVRRLLPGETGPTGGPALTDATGICESWGDGVVGLRLEDGTLLEIRTEDIVAGKQIPPRPPRRRQRH